MSNQRVSDFQARVYAAVLRVPRGRVTSYGLLARYLGCGSPRAVGQALKRNPFAPDVPCHRVIASDLSLGGFKGSTTRAMRRQKANLLKREGVKLRDGKLVDVDKVYRFDTNHRAPDARAGNVDFMHGGSRG